jgi:hypothetical protein
MKSIITYKVEFIPVTDRQLEVFKNRIRLYQIQAEVRRSLADPKSPINQWYLTGE